MGLVSELKSYQFTAQLRLISRPGSGAVFPSRCATRIWGV